MVPRDVASDLDDPGRISIVRCDEANVARLALLRQELWPLASATEHRDEIAEYFRRFSGGVAFLAIEDGTAVGFAEATLRRDYVNGCESSPVAFLEGIYVKPEHRLRGIARLLNRSVEAWVRLQGCHEYASDADLANLVSHAVHVSLGFEETERVVFFRKQLKPD